MALHSEVCMTVFLTFVVVEHLWQEEELWDKLLGVCL